MNQASEGGNGSSGYAAPTGEPEAKPNESTPTHTPEAQTGGDQFDEFGYKKTPETAGGGSPTGEAEKQSEQTATPEQTKEIPNSSGYGEVEPEAPTEEKQKDAAPPKAELPFEIKAEGLPEDEVIKLVEFFKTNEVDEKTAKAIAENRRQMYADQKVASEKFEKDKAAEVAKIKQGWYNELRNDPVFGGNNFKASVASVDKLVEEHMPNFKKQLTTNKSMLPPYLMRDLAKISEKMYGTEKFVQGESLKPEEQPISEDDQIRNMYK